MLDLFSGTGSLGIEALSRGAAWVDFVEHDRPQCTVITSNLAATGFGDQAQVHRADVYRLLPTLPGPFQLVMMDPPYKMGDFSGLLETMASQRGLMVDGGVVIAGHSKRLELRASYGTLQLTSHREYGDNVVDFYIYQEPAEYATEADIPALASDDSGAGDPKW